MPFETLFVTGVVAIFAIFGVTLFVAWLSCRMTGPAPSRQPSRATRARRPDTTPAPPPYVGG
ncbi:MAG TPA: hypothetical protein VEC60_04520 [Reyranella sp.]|nr:hypothetical protein [Reyranella sp.]